MEAKLITVCRLRDLGIVDNDGLLADFKCNTNQTYAILQSLIKIMNGGPARIKEYLDMGIRNVFPDMIVYHIILKHHSSL